MNQEEFTKLNKMTLAKGKRFSLTGSPDYAPVLFRETDISTAIFTAVKAKARLYLWDNNSFSWNPVFIPEEYTQEQTDRCNINIHHHLKCRYDCLFQKNDSYYYDGAGIIVLPERIVINRYTLFEDKKLPNCPLNEYDIYSDADYYEMERLLHELPPYNPEDENPDKLVEEEEEILSFGENPTFHRVYTYLPYTHWRLKQILNDYYGASMVCVRGYKEGRYIPNYKQRYNIYWNNTGKLAAKNIHLDTLRYIFAEKEFPLHEPDIGRNHGAAMFLNIIQQIKNQQKNM